MADIDMTRRGAAKSLALGLSALSAPTAALAAGFSDNAGNPGRAWQRWAKPEDAGFSPSGLAKMEGGLYAKPTTSVMIVKGGKVAYTYGDVTEASYLASARKSVISMLYGAYVAKGVIKLDETLGQIGIDEKAPGLTPEEKSATVRDLLMASSGVYYPPDSPGSGDNPPARGSHKPGTYWYYNNWDFNVVGAIFQKKTGKSVFQALDEELARPLGFEDFDVNRQRMLGFAGDPSHYKAYHLFLSCRDMARLGVCMINGGRWDGRQVVPEAWVRESTALHVPGAKMNGRDGSMGYAYLWWKPSESRKDPEWADSFMASGQFGQYILGLPAIDTVIVHRRAVTDEYALARNLGLTDVRPAGGEIDFLPIADAILAARAV